MNEDQQKKCHVCRFCNQSFSNGKKLGGHMRRHLALISTCRKMSNQEAINGDNGLDVSDDDDHHHITKKTENARKQGMQENDQEIINAEAGLDFDDVDDEMIKKGQQETDVDQDYIGANVYILRENPKRSWRVSNSSKDYGKKKCDSRKESMKVQCVCDKCDKSFNSMKALYGHMRCHSIRRSRPFDESSLMSSSNEHDDDEVANPVRKKRSCTRYKSPKPNHHCSTSLSCSDDEVEQGAICLMMLFRGVRSLDEFKLVISQEVEFASSDYGYKKKIPQTDVIVESGSSQSNPDWAGSTSTLVKYNSPSDQDFGDMDTTDSDISLEMKRISKDHNCPICMKEFRSGRALGCHKRVHNNTERKVRENNHTPDVHRRVNPDLDFVRKVSTMVKWGSSYSGS